MKNYWLFKSEPQSFGWDKLLQQKNQTSAWDGVRNYLARNYMKQMQVGDQAFFYHSSCPTPAIIGVVNVVKLAYPDHTAFDISSPYYDPKATTDNPRWFMVEVKAKEPLKRMITLNELKEHSTNLDDLQLLKKGNRLSIFPVSEKSWKYIVSLSNKK